MNTIATDPQIYIQSLFDPENPDTPTPTPVPPLRDHTISETLDVLQTHTESFTSFFTEEAGSPDDEPDSIISNLVLQSHHAVNQAATGLFQSAREADNLDILFEHPSVIYRLHCHRVLCVWTIRNTNAVLQADAATAAYLKSHGCSPDDLPAHTPKVNTARIFALADLQPRIPDTGVPPLASMALQTVVNNTAEQLADYASCAKYSNSRTPASHAMTLAVHHLARMLLNPTFTPPEPTDMADTST